MGHLTANVSATVGDRKPRFYLQVVLDGGYLLNPKRGQWATKVKTDAIFKVRIFRK